MCRLFGFRSAINSSAHTSLLAAKNALAQQSVQHRDGWGLAYYVDRYPHLVRSEKQALEDSLFAELSTVVETRCLLAHIRAATAGKVSVLNCHPFQHGAWTFAHNGKITGFTDAAGLREKFCQAVDERYRKSILGDTDSELIFYIFLSRLARRVADVSHVGVSLERTLAALRETVELIRSIADGEAKEASLLNFLLTNGSLMVGFRHGKELFFSTCKTRCAERETCYAFDPDRCEKVVTDGLVKHLIVTSEPVSEGSNVWQELSDGDYVAVGHGMHFSRGRLEEALL